MNARTERTPIDTPRCAVLVGPYLSGKTSLLESLLAACGAIPRQGSVKDGNSTGDASPEARARQMSVEPNIAHARYMDEPWVFIDCPGSIEFAQDYRNALQIADVAVVVCEADPARALTVAPILKYLDDEDIPHLLFVNRMDEAPGRVRELLAALQAHSRRPLVLRQVPIREGERVTGYVDLASERAYRYKPGQPSDLIQIPDESRPREQEARGEMLEALADFDDRLLEQLLEDMVPETHDIYRTLAKDLQSDLIVPVFLGAAEKNHGVHRLLKALRHEVSDAAHTAGRKAIPPEGEPLLQVFKTLHLAHTGKLSLARIWRGGVKDGQMLTGPHGQARISGLYHLLGSNLAKISEASPGDVVAMGKMEPVATGDALTPSDHVADRMTDDPAWPEPLAPVYAMALHAANRNDEVKLSGALAKLVEEDPSLTARHDADTGELLLSGQGDIHLQIAADRLKSKYNLEVTLARPQVPYKETIRRKTEQHARHKKQSGGHGQFADVKIAIQPLPRGSGFQFVDKIVGGAIPRQYIPSVEEGVREFMPHGPLGYPVVDFQVTLQDGQFHSVDSSDMAFKLAARQAMAEGMAKCDPVLLEPILAVAIAVPNEFTSKVQRLITGRRGQILGYDSRAGWQGWDEVQCFMPQAEIHDLIIELRSATLGVGSYSQRFDHLQELTGRLADQAVAAQ